MARDEGGIKKENQDADVPGHDKRIELAEMRTEQAETRSEQAIRVSEPNYRRLFEAGEGRHPDSGSRNGANQKCEPLAHEIQGRDEARPSKNLNS